ncbi:hypothetical protein [Amaricoccus sp.]|uniref:hypothetical protein n=1 Tax=Amaricoccus sp. TaxID=1872485 RepID=UPI002626CF0A|nr:hypothetical protein [uncultured Amaricoccus sp.]
MVLTLAFAIGMLVGWRRAALAGGDRLDKLQYAAAHGIALTLAVFTAWILAVRFGWL